MIYLNNAGTTWPKPKAVTQSLSDFTHLSPSGWPSIFDDGLETTLRFFNIPFAERLLFTTSCTSSLALALTDFSWNPGDRFIMSAMEHHALSRWFYKLQHTRGVEGVIIPRAEDGPFDLKYFESELIKGVRMVAISMASNVTGEILPYEDILKLTHKYNAFCLLDCAQTAGLIPIDIAQLKPDIFVFAGHKAPLGPQGIGGLYIDPAVPMTCPKAVCEIVPGEISLGAFPTYCDSGSVNMMALSGMTAGLKWLEEKGWDELQGKRSELVKELRNGLEQIQGIKILGSNDLERTTGAVSVISERFTPADLDNQLWNNYAIKASVGFQCSPLAHEALGTHRHGTIRFSVGALSSRSDVDILLEALKELH